MTANVTLPAVAAAAYWLHRPDAATALFLLRLAHIDLLAMAGAMGYTLTPKVAETDEVTA